MCVVLLGFDVVSFRFYIFFFKQKTAYELRISDWSSDVCSSDLTGVQRGKYRLFAVWNRAVTPRGVAIDVGSPASDALGRSGMAGGVKNFFWERFGAALL